MTVAYIVSMFPRLSETFILNELINHERAGLEVSIFSIRPFNEPVLNTESLRFVEKTVYCKGKFWLEIWFLHTLAIMSTPSIYFSILTSLLWSQPSRVKVKFNALVVFFCAPYFCRAAKRLGVEHLHAHFANYPALLAWIVSKFNRVPFTVTAHAYDIYFSQDVLRLIASDASAIVTISDFNRRFILAKLALENSKQADKVRVLRCGIDPAAYEFNPKRRQRPTPAPFRLLSVGRLTGIKGFKYLLEAVALLKRDGCAVVCKIIGDGPLRQELLAQRDTLGLGSEVIFLGARPTQEVVAHMREADAFVLACATDPIEKHDGIPVVFMEAMALGVPVVGTTLSGLPELIVHGQTGLCAATEDPRSLKAAIGHLMEHDEQGLAMAGRARKLVEQEYDAGFNAARLRQIFAEARPSISGDWRPRISGEHS